MKTRTIEIPRVDPARVRTEIASLRARIAELKALLKLADTQSLVRPKGVCGDDR